MRQAADVRGRGRAPDSTLGGAEARPRGVQPGSAVRDEGEAEENGARGS